MSAPEGRPFSRITGGREAFDRAHAEVSLAAAVAQARLSATLDRIGPPGQTAWDPVAGTVMMRSRTFAAQQLGSFDGQSWLWSWANPHLVIPDEKTALARSLRDRAEEIGVPAFAVPMIEARDERLPYMLGAFAIAHGAGEAYYLANQSQVYMFEPGQLDRTKDTPLDQLRAAIAAADAQGVAYDLARGLPRVAKQLGIEVATEDRAIVAREGTSELRFHLTADGHALQTCALLFASKSTTTADVFTHLKKVRGAAELPLKQIDDATLAVEGPGYAVRITRSDRLKDVMREARRTRNDEAKRYGAVFVVSACTTPSYVGVQLAVVRQAFVGASWVPAEHVGTDDGGPAAGPLISNEALQICERLNQLPKTLVYDTLLQTEYPRGK